MPINSRQATTMNLGCAATFVIRSIAPRLPWAILLIALTLSSTGCVYFNTFYLARKNFNQAESSRKKEKRDKASGAELKGYQEAIKKCSKVLSESPNSSWADDALFIIGKSYYYLGESSKAERMFRDLLSSFPDSKYAEESRFFLGKSRYRLENYDLAREVFSEYIVNSKNNDWRAEATYLMAEMYRTDERYDEAIKYYQELTQKYKSDFRRQEAQFKVGQLQFQKEQYAAAESSFALAADLASDPKAKFNARYEQGRSLYKIDSVNAGMAIFEQLRSEQRDSVYLGQVLLRIAEGTNLRGEEREAILLYDDVAVNFVKRVESAEAYYRLGEIAQNKWGDLIVAKDMYQQASKEQRGDIWRAQALEKVSDITRVESYMASLADDTTDAVVTNRFLLAEMYRTDLERPDSALAEYKVIAEKYPGNDIAARALLAIGWLYENQYADTAQAHTYYQRVVDQYPKSDAVRQAISLLSLQDAEPYEFYPDKVYALAEDQYFDQHNLDSARTLFERVVKEYPGSRLVPKAEFAVARIDLERFVPQNKVIARPVIVDSTKDTLSQVKASASTTDSLSQTKDSVKTTIEPKLDSLAGKSSLPAGDSAAISPQKTDAATIGPPAPGPVASDSFPLAAYVNPTDSLIRPSELLGRNRKNAMRNVPTDSTDSTGKSTGVATPDTSAHQRILDAITKGVSAPRTNDSTKAPNVIDSTKIAKTPPGPPSTATAKPDSTQLKETSPAVKDTTTQKPAVKPAAPAVPKDTILIDSTMIWRFQALAEKYAGTPIGDEAARLAQGNIRQVPRPQQPPQQHAQQTPVATDTLAKSDSTAAAPLDSLSQAQLDEKRLQDEYERWPLLERKPTNDIEFNYPLDAAPSKFQGRVEVKIKIAFDGKVNDVQFLKGSGIASIDQEIDRVLRLTEFDPALIDPLKIGGYFIYKYEVILPEVYR